MHASLSHDDLLSALKAAGDQTRLRLLVLLGKSELNVKDLTTILGQSQPRLSRHLKLLSQAKLIERFQEGSWVYYRLKRDGNRGEFIKTILNQINLKDPALAKDEKAAAKLKSQRATEAQAYFKTNAKDWDRIRTLYISEAKVEAEMKKLIGKKPIQCLLDLGTGTGRILELFIKQYKRAIGFDINNEMLRHARARLERLDHKNCELRRGDITDLDVPNSYADTIIMHQILHFLEEPQKAIHEASRLLGSKGRLLIIDFAPHSEEQLRKKFAHRWLGLSEQQLSTWLNSANLKKIAFNTLKSNKQNAKTGLDVSLCLAQKQG